jgi:tryptophanyl-tRNA synthetase
LRVVSGIQPSGALHLGNYLGAVKQFIEFQERGEALYFIADLHALTSVRDGARLRQLSGDLALDLLALGVDPARAVLFRQSAIPEVTELAWILSTVWPASSVLRGHAYKDKTRRGLAASVGLLTYPVLMAADILSFEADLVPVGSDQAQHLELARDAALKLNQAYVPGFDADDPARPGLVRLPRAFMVDDRATVPGTDGRKMSKSYGNTLELFAPERELEKRILSMKTDSSPIDAAKPLDAPLLALLVALAGPSEAEEHRRSFAGGGVGYAAYKRRLFELFLGVFAKARERRRELAADPAVVAQLLAAGAERARQLAQPTLVRVRNAVGLS